VTDEGLTDEEIRARGYEPTPQGWVLKDPATKPPPRRELCRMCSKFVAMLEGWCAGCLWFGPGDPHGLRQTSPEVGIEQRELPPPVERAELVERVRAAAARQKGSP
jgi:hypothetical protein